MSENNGNNSIQALAERINSLEYRIRRIESAIGSTSYDIQGGYGNPEGEVSKDALRTENDNQAIEANVMEYGLVWLSSIVFLLGIIFLMSFIGNKGYPAASSLVGYAAAVSVFLLSYFLRRAFPHMMSLLTICGLLLLYYTSIRLYYFAEAPIIPIRFVALTITLAVITAQVIYSIRKNSEFLAAISLILLLLTALIDDSAFVTLFLILLSSVTSLILCSRLGWWRLMILVNFIAYFSHFLWLLNNPLMGHPLQAVASHHNSLIFLLSYAIVFSLSLVIPMRKAVPSHFYGSISFINVINFTLGVMLEISFFYKDEYGWILGLISILSILFSVILKGKSEKLFTPAFYACFGFMTLSGAIYGYAEFPVAYLLLALQSLLVVSLALWFRSKIIVVVNTILYLAILAAYLLMSPPDNSVNFVFAFVAFATARILNWKKERLVLKTELLRNIYLASGFILVLYALNHAVPGQFVTLAWTIAALFYFMMSILLHNTKYRRMGIMTILLTGIHLLLVDMAKMETGNRIIAFLFFAFISLGVSLYYTKRIKKKSSEIQ